MGAVHDAGRRRAVLRRAGPPGAAADRGPAADDRPGAQRLRHPRQRPVLPVRPGLRQATCPSAMQDIDQAKSLLEAGRAGGPRTSSWSPRRRWARARWSRPTCSSSRPSSAGVDVQADQGRRQRLLRRPLPVLELRPGLLEHPQLPPAGGRVRRSRARTYNETHFDDPQFTALIDQAKREPDAGQAQPAAARRAGDRVQHGRLHHLGLQAPARRLLEPGAGPRSRTATCRARTSGSSARPSSRPRHEPTEARQHDRSGDRGHATTVAPATRPHELGAARPG